MSVPAIRSPRKKRALRDLFRSAYTDREWLAIFRELEPKEKIAFLTQLEPKKVEDEGTDKGFQVFIQQFGSKNAVAVAGGRGNAAPTIHIQSHSSVESHPMIDGEDGSLDSGASPEIEIASFPKLPPELYTSIDAVPDSAEGIESSGEPSPAFSAAGHE